MQTNRCAVRYVANAGLLFEAAGERFGVDVFCQDPLRLYPDTPPGLRRELLTEIENGKLETLFFTHEHGDHFCPADVREAFERNTGLRVISNGKVTEKLRQMGIPDEALCRETGWMNLGEVRIGFLPSVHEGAQYADVENLTLLIEAAGQHWVVPGDAAATPQLFASIAAWSPEIDCFFAPFPYVGLRSARRMLAEALQIRRIFVLHQPRPEADVQNWRENARLMCRRAKDSLPMPVFPEQPGEWMDLS